MQGNICESPYVKEVVWLGTKVIELFGQCRDPYTNAFRRIDNFTKVLLRNNDIRPLTLIGPDDTGERGLLRPPKGDLQACAAITFWGHRKHLDRRGVLRPGAQVYWLLPAKFRYIVSN